MLYACVRASVYVCVLPVWLLVMWTVCSRCYCRFPLEAWRKLIFQLCTERPGVRVLSIFHYHHYYITTLVSSMFLNGGSWWMIKKIYIKNIYKYIYSIHDRMWKNKSTMVFLFRRLLRPPPPNTAVSYLLTTLCLCVGRITGYKVIMKWHCNLVYGWMVYTELTPKRQHFTWHQPCNTQRTLPVHHFRGY